MRITVIKCPETGKLFENDASYEKHVQEMQEQARHKASVMQLGAEQAALVAKMRKATSLAEYFALFNQLELAKNTGDLSGAKFVELRLTGHSPLSLGSHRLRITVDVFSKTDSTSRSWSNWGTHTAPGFGSGCGNGAKAPKKDAPTGANYVMHCQSELDLRQLPGLLATQAAIYAGRAAMAQQAQLLLQAARTEVAGGPAVLKRQKEIDAKINKATALREELALLDTAVRQHTGRLEKQALALQTARLALDTEQEEALKSLEAQLPVAPGQNSFSY